MRDVLNARQIAERYFFPTPAQVPDVTWVHVDDAQLSCWRSPTEFERTVVHFHGNGETVTDWIDSALTRAILGEGWNVFLAEYRGYSQSTGEPFLGQMLDDLDAIRGAVGVQDGSLVVFGRSVGSIFAVEWVRQFPQTAGVVLESGIADVFERLALRVRAAELGLTHVEFRDAVERRLHPPTALASYPGKSLFLHAERDDLVHISHARTNARAASNGRLVAFDRGDHNSIFYENSSQYLREVRSFLAELST